MKVSEPFTEASPEVERMLPDLTLFVAWLVSNAERLRELPDEVITNNLRGSAAELLNSAMGYAHPPESGGFWDE